MFQLRSPASEYVEAVLPAPVIPLFPRRRDPARDLRGGPAPCLGAFQFCFHWRTSHLP